MVQLLCSAHSSIIMTMFSVLTLLVDSAPTITVSHLYSVMKSEAKLMYWDTYMATTQFEALRVGHSMNWDWSLTGLPSLANWVVLERLTASEADMLQTHISNLQIFERALEYMVADEQNYGGAHSFRVQFRHIRVRVNNLIAGMQHIMSLKNLVGVNQVPITATLVFSSNADDEEINKRDLVVLRELNRYTLDLAADVNRLKIAHG